MNNTILPLFSQTNRLFLVSLLFVMKTCTAQPNPWQSALLKINTENEIEYFEDENGFVLPDFSYAGYARGTREIPKVKNIIRLHPIEGDNTIHIQEAIDKLALMPANKEGIRGAIYLHSGIFEIQGQLLIQESGIVLRGTGSGENPEQNTIIYGVGNSPAERELIVFGTTQEKNPNIYNIEKVKPKISTTIVDTLVKVGSRSFDVEDASFFSKGDRILIHHACSEAWLEAVDYGDVADNKAWAVGEHPIIYDRRIESIEGNTITVFAPVFYSLNKALTEIKVYPYPTYRKVIQQVGIENIRINNSYTHPEDEAHVYRSVVFRMVENAWASNCVATHFTRAGFTVEFSRQVTIEHCKSIDPISLIEGGRRYNFDLRQGTQLVLIKDCYARNGRHHFVGGRSTCSGNVIYNCISDATYGFSESHLHWSTGLLFDNLSEINVREKNQVLLGLFNRGSWGHSHGWSCAHCVAWNYDSGTGRAVVQKPPTAQNYIIGCRGKVDNNWTFEHPIGHVEGINQEVLLPYSLYLTQLKAREGLE